MNIEEVNQALKGKTPEEVIRYFLEIAKNPVITTNFGPYEVVLLHAVTQNSPDIPVIWCDTGYNTRETYVHAEQLIEQLNLNIDLYVPQQTVAHRNVVLGIPDVDAPEHTLFTEQVKLEPFTRAMKKHQPDVWFTNLRKHQTEFRSNLDVLSVSSDGVLKVSPFFYYTDEELDTYLATHNLPNESRYYDPTKVLSNRECGLHN